MSSIAQIRKDARADAKQLGDEDLREKVARLRRQLMNMSSLYFKETDARCRIYEAEQARRGLEPLPLFP